MILERIQYPSKSFNHYWQQPHWKRELSKLRRLPEKDEILAFSKYYLQSEDLGAFVIEELLPDFPHGELFSFISLALEKPELAIKYPYTSQLLNECLSFPEWVDTDLLEEGAAFARRSGVLGLLVLRNFSLMGGYESSAVNKPLVFTSELKKVAGKRISETTEFWVNVIEENLFKSGTKGIGLILRVRLVHALARYYILKNPAWNSQAWGLPINAADMMATNLGFSLLFMTGLERLNYKLSPKEEEGFFHLWRFIGHYQGIPSELLPHNRQEAVRLLYIWTMTQPEGDQDAIALAQSLLNIPKEPQFSGTKFQKWIIYEANLSFNQFFLSRNSCRNLGLPKSRLPFFPYISKWMVKILAFKYRNNRNDWVKKAREIQLEIKEKAMEDYGTFDRK
jgi:hypothetical protein